MRKCGKCKYFGYRLCPRERKVFVDDDACAPAMAEARLILLADELQKWADEQIRRRDVGLPLQSYAEANAPTPNTTGSE